MRENMAMTVDSQIEYSGGDVSIEDLIADESVVITISHAGYIKRTSLSEYKTQNRGGVGQKKCREQEIKISGAFICCYKPSIFNVFHAKR